MNIEFPPNLKKMSLRSEDGVVEFATNMMKVCKSTMEGSGAFAAIAAVIANKDPNGNPFPAEIAPFSEDGYFPILVQSDEDFNDVDAKDRFARTIRHLVEKTEAIGVLFMSEAWIVSGNASTPVDQSKSLSTHPDREEVIAIFLEHVALFQQWTAPIIRTDGVDDVSGEKKEIIRVGEFTTMLKDEKGKRATTGRLSNFLPASAFASYQ